MKNQTDFNIDTKTALYIRHLLAGKIANIEYCAECLKEGKTNFSTGENINDVLLRDAKEVKNILINLTK